MEIRQLRPYEIELHREIRLRALRDAPDSFAETAIDAEARPSSYWESLTRAVAEPGRDVMFLAVEDNRVLGSIYGLRGGQDTHMAKVGGTWVAPVHRRRGVGRALLQAVMVWARDQGFVRLGLWAPQQGAAALALYARAGFLENGRRRSLGSNAGLQIVELECDPA